MNASKFADLAAAGYRRVPVSREILADLDTPLSAYLKLAGRPNSFLLESVQGGEKWARFSFIGLPCRRAIRVRRHTIEEIEEGNIIAEHQVDDPLAWIADYQARFASPPSPDLPTFSGGLIGYFGYDSVRYIEDRLAQWPEHDPLNTPDILLLVCEELVVVDNLRGKLKFIVNVDPQKTDALTWAQGRLDSLIERLQQPLPYRPARRRRDIKESEFASELGAEGYMSAVEHAREQIAAGECMQVVLSQRMSVPLSAPPLDVYRALRTLNPSPYMYFIDFGDHQVVGSSPEILARFENDEITVRPIAGTRPRGANAQEDKALEESLLSDPKELAEHLMLIDLGRNDVGRIAKTGSVRVTEKMTIERYSHVMHIVSHVVGDALPGTTAMDVFRAAHPAGTLSGSPKVRAMEIIDKLEPSKRGVYGGAVGYFSFSGSMDTAIAIRTAVIKDERLYIQAGAGVVYDSIAENEWAETLNKGRAMFRAAALAERGLEQDSDSSVTGAN